MMVLQSTQVHQQQCLCVIDIPNFKYFVSNSFNLTDRLLFHGDEKEIESRTTLCLGGGQMIRPALQTNLHQAPQVDP
jgi:hypothetical protein